jgi:uncharacterized RDD family membrane protein YckC
MSVSGNHLGTESNPIDPVRVLETPEGVDLSLHLAGPVPRAAAFVLDLLVRAAVYLALAPLLALAGVGTGLLLLALFLLEWFYPVFFELARGATPGKRALGLLVVHDDGTVTMMLDRDFRRLGDLAAGTLVIHASPDLSGRNIPPHASSRPWRTLDLEAQQAILDYAERCPGLSPERRIELAEVLTAADGWHGQAAVDRLLGVANWIARGR